ncbi:MAG: MarR family transcriptional regulator [Nocardioidaceae bacterium]
MATRTINAVIVKSLAAVDDTATVSQLRVMVLLTKVGSASLSEVADDLGVNPSNASRTCDQLVRRTLLVRDEDPADRRRLSLTLSASGRRLVDKVMKKRLSLLEEVVGSMSVNDQETLMVALESFNVAAESTGVPVAVGPEPARRLGRWVE